MSTRGRLRWDNPGLVARAGYGRTSEEIVDDKSQLGRFDRGMSTANSEFEILAPVYEKLSSAARQRFRQNVDLARYCYLSDGARWQAWPSRADQNAMLSEVFRALDTFIAEATAVAPETGLCKPARDGPMRYEHYIAFTLVLNVLSQTRQIGPQGDVYRAMAIAAGKLCAVLLHCDDRSEGAMLDRLPGEERSRFDHLDDLVRYATRLRTAASDARVASIPRRGPERPEHIDAVVAALVSAFEDAGFRVTHTPHSRDGIYDGQPHSQADILITRFLKAVDPRINTSNIMTALDRAMKRRRRRRKPSN